MSQTSIAKRTILVVEDEKPLVRIIVAKLESVGFAVVAAGSIEQAWHHLETAGQVDAVWLDHYLLGEESGLDLVIKLKQPESRWKDLPVFVVSNTASQDKVEAYYKLGIVNYYVKAENRLDTIIEGINAWFAMHGK